MSGVGGRTGRRKLRRRGDEESDEDEEHDDANQADGVNIQEQQQHAQLDRKLQECGFDIDPDMSVAEKRDLLQALVASSEDFKKETNLRELELAQSQVEDPDWGSDNGDGGRRGGQSAESARKADDVMSVNSSDGEQQNETLEDCVLMQKVGDEEPKKGAKSNNKTKSIDTSKNKRLPKRLLEMSFPSDTDSANETKETRHRSSTPVPSTSRGAVKRKRGNVRTDVLTGVVDSGEEFKPAKRPQRGGPRKTTVDDNISGMVEAAVVADALDEDMKAETHEAPVTMSAEKQAGLPPRKKRRCMQLGDVENTSTAAAQRQRTSEKLMEPPELTDDETDDEAPGKSTRDVEIQQSFGEDEASSDEVNLIVESDVVDSDDSAIFDLRTEPVHDEQKSVATVSKMSPEEVTPEKVHSPEVSPIHQDERLSDVGTPSPNQMPRFPCSASSTPEIDLTNSPVLAGRRIERTTVVPPTPDEAVAGTSSRRSLEFDEDETQDPNERAPSPNATVGEETIPTSGPPPGATLDVDETEMSASQDLFDIHRPHKPKMMPTTRPDDPFEMDTNDENVQPSARSAGLGQVTGHRQKKDSSESDVSPTRKVFIPQRCDFPRCDADKDEDHVPSSPPRILPRKFKKQVEDRNPYFAPKTICPREYAKQIVAYFEQYRRVLRSAQSQVYSPLAWGAPVTVGRHMSRSIDFWRRGQPDHTLEPIGNSSQSPACMQIDANDSSDEGEFITKRRSSNLQNLKPHRPQQAQATITCDNDDSDDFELLPNFYGKKRRVEPAVEDTTSTFRFRNKASDVEYHPVTRTAPAAQSSPLPSSSRMLPSASDKFDELFAADKSDALFPCGAKQVTLKKLDKTSAKNIPHLGSPDVNPVIKDSSQEYTDDFFADENIKSSRYNKSGHTLASQEYVAGDLSADLVSSVSAGQHAMLRQQVKGDESKSITSREVTAVADDSADLGTAAAGGDADVTDELKLQISVTQDGESTVDSDRPDDPTYEDDGDCEDSFASNTSRRPARKSASRKTSRSTNLHRKVMVRGQEVEKDILCTTMSPVTSEPKLFESLLEDQDESRLDILNLSDSDGPIEVKYVGRKKVQRKRKQADSHQNTANNEVDEGNIDGKDEKCTRMPGGERWRGAGRDVSQEDDTRDEPMDTSHDTPEAATHSKAMGGWPKHASNEEQSILNTEEAPQKALPGPALNVAIPLPLLQSNIATQSEKSEEVECPICSRFFSKERIEEHADICLETMMAEEAVREMTPPREVMIGPRVTRHQTNSPAAREPLRRRQMMAQDEASLPARGTRRRVHQVENITIEDDDDEIKDTPVQTRKRAKYVSLLDDEPVVESTHSTEDADDFENTEVTDESTFSGSEFSDDEEDNMPLSSRAQQARDSPITLHFQPISQQQNSLFDYQNQFRRTVRDPKRFNRATKTKKGKKRKTRKRKSKSTAKKASSTKASTAGKKKGTSSQPKVHIT